MSLYTLITATVLSATGQVHTASVLENLSWDACAQHMTQQREALRQTPQAAAQRWYLTCVPMPAAQGRTAAAGPADTIAVTNTSTTNAAAAAPTRSVQ